MPSAIKKTNKGDRKTPSKRSTGLSLELVVTRIQQMMDSNSTVSHNEILGDRVGNKRQYDVVIRGKFGGRPVLGVIECKDHSRRKGPGTIEAFAKKTENLGANLRLMVSRKGFTKQALKLAKHENIGCLSLLPENPEQVGFGIGDTWYGVILMWRNVRLMIYFASKPSPISTFDANTVKWEGKPVVNWFKKQLFTTYRNEKKEGEFTLEVKFSKVRNLEIEGNEYPVLGLSCIAERTYQKKKKWVFWSGDAFFDWQINQFTIPPKGVVIGSAIATDLREWDDFEGEIPKLGKQNNPGFIRGVLYNTQKWDSAKDDDVPNLDNL